MGSRRGRPLILKSPTHGFRVATLRELLPDARFVLIVRDPSTHFESVVRMWRKMFETYSLGAIPSDDEIREAVISDRLRFEAKLAAGTQGLAANRLATLTYESLVADPVTVCERLYGQLDLGDFLPARGAIAAESEGRREYRARSSEASAGWRERIGGNGRRCSLNTAMIRGDVRDLVPRLPAAAEFNVIPDSFMKKIGADLDDHVGCTAGHGKRDAPGQSIYDDSGNG